MRNPSPLMTQREHQLPTQRAARLVWALHVGRECGSESGKESPSGGSAGRGLQRGACVAGPAPGLPQLSIAFPVRCQCAELCLIRMALIHLRIDEVGTIHVCSTSRFEEVSPLLETYQVTSGCRTCQGGGGRCHGSVLHGERNIGQASPRTAIPCM